MEINFCKLEDTHINTDSYTENIFFLSIYHFRLKKDIFFDSRIIPSLAACNQRKLGIVFFNSLIPRQKTS